MSYAMTHPEYLASRDNRYIVVCFDENNRRTGGYAALNLLSATQYIIAQQATGRKCIILPWTKYTDEETMKICLDDKHADISRYLSLAKEIGNKWKGKLWGTMVPGSATVRSYLKVEVALAKEGTPVGEEYR